MSDAPSEEFSSGLNRGGGHQRRPQIVEDGGAEIDRFFDALGDTRRRLVLLHLNHHDNDDLEHIVESIAKYEGVEPSDEEVGRIRVDLYHRQLPKLADHGLISFDTRTNEICLEPVPEAVERILDLTRDLEGLDDR
ncbi:DUF7344 domain-containing protein [Halorarum halophilum]